MTAAEAGRLFGVSCATANSAMCVLAERQLLVRHRSRGSFGGPKLERPTAVGAPSVCIIRRGDIPQAFEHVRSDEMISALRQTIDRTTNVQFCFPPDRGALDGIRPVIKAGQGSTQRFGVIARSCTCEVYQYLIDNAVPTVVLGTPFAGQDDLPSIDLDNVQGGRLLMEYLIRCGHDRIGMLSLLDHLPGDNDFLHGLHDAMSEVGRLPNTLRSRIIPVDSLAVTAEVEHLIARPDRPTALIVRSDHVGAIAVDVASKMGLAVPGDIEIVFSDRRWQAGQRGEHTHLRHAMSIRQFYEQAGAMLDRLWRGVPLDKKHLVVPVTLCERESI